MQAKPKGSSHAVANRIAVALKSGIHALTNKQSLMDGEGG